MNCVSLVWWLVFEAEVSGEGKIWRHFTAWYPVLSSSMGLCDYWDILHTRNLGQRWSKHQQSPTRNVPIIIRPWWSSRHGSQSKSRSKTPSKHSKAICLGPCIHPKLTTSICFWLPHPADLGLLRACGLLYGFTWPFRKSEIHFLVPKIC